ncbi:hypothetical protein [Actinoplanes sp. NPDC051494]|uniref:hypothetical protein n=1 Tax=Actinoplanes sp. NPDC051494 TaxID=3363907 RepID=UPI003787E7E9
MPIDPLTTLHAVPAGRRRRAREFWHLKPKEKAGLIHLTGQVDRLELKVVVPVDAHASTCKGLGVDISRATSRRVYFLDTADLALERHGVVVRARSTDGSPSDSVIKLRPMVPGELPARLRRSPNFVVEIDAMPGNYVCSGAMRRRLDPDEVDRTMRKGRPVRGLFSAEQRELFTAYAPAGVALDDLIVHGPVTVRRGKVRPSGWNRPLTIEQWTYPDGSRLLELSTRCAAGKAERVVADFAAVLRRCHVDIELPQRTKTRATLAYFTYRRARRPAA